MEDGDGALVRSGFQGSMEAVMSAHGGRLAGLGVGKGLGLRSPHVSSQLLWLPHSMVAGLQVSHTWPWKSRTITSAIVTNLPSF